MRRLVALFGLVSSGMFVFAACGGGGAESGGSTMPTASASGAETSAASASSAAMDWESMSHGQRLETMKKVVVPKMGAVFQSFDAKKFADFNCVVCHGERIKQKNFDMPNPDLPHLSYTDGFKKHMTEKPEITKFMMDKVEPEMAAALGMHPYDPKTQKGFGCGGCHVVGP
jgi:hypothetical protein